MQDKKWWLVLMLSVLSVGANFWGFPVYILDEAKNSACAMEMMQRGDWVVPTFNNVLRTDKPPLHYFFMIGSYKMFGISPFSARLFSVLFGILTIWLVYFFTKKMIGQRAALYSSLILACSLHFIIQFHLAVPDPYLILFLTGSWLCFTYGYQTNRSLFYYLSYLALALAFMAKGPVAIALTGIIFLVFLISQDDLSFRALARLKAWQGIILFLMIALPWWVSVTLRTKGEWLGAFIMGHNVGRYISSMEGHTAFPGLAILLFFVSLLPLSFYFPGAFKLAWAERKTNSLAFFSLIVVLTVVAFFCFSKTVLPSYIAPAIPFGAILIGSFIDRKIGDPSYPGIGRKVGTIVALLFACALPFILRSVIAQDRWISDLTEISWLFAPISIGALIAVFYVFRNRWKESLLSYLLSFWLVGILLFYKAAPAILAKNPVNNSMELIQKSGREVLGYYFFNSAYIFSLQRPLPTFYTPAELKIYSEGKSVIIVSRKDYEAELVAAGFTVIFEKPYLFESSVAIVLINQP